jgi:tetratricopeptide (TPR) repeat protein
VQGSKFKVWVIIFILGVQSFGSSYLSQANDAYRRGDYKQATVFYKKAFAAGENPALVFFNLGNSYYQLDSLHKAVVYYESAIQDAPDFFRAYLNLGIIYYDFEDWPNAIAALESARTLEPENIQVLMMLAIAYKYLENYGLSVISLTEVLELDPAQVDCYFLLYDVYQILEDWESATFYLNRYPDRGKRADEKYRLLGEMAEIDRDFERAAVCYQRQAELAPGNRWAFYKLVEANHKCGRILFALEKAHFALDKFSDFEEIALLAGNIAFKAGYLREAQKFYSRAYRMGHASGLIGLQNLLKTFRNQNNSSMARQVETLISRGF